MIVIVLATLSTAVSRPPGRFTSVMPVADPPYLNVIGSIASPSQTICCPRGAVV